VGIRLRAAIVSTIYRKALRVATSASNGPGGSSTGQIVNLLAVDLQRMQDMLQFMWLVWYAPLNLVITMVLLYMQVNIQPQKIVISIKLLKNKFYSLTVLE
jgi:ATP-binding cassette, subfamily C (CFTR/MRP), member 1